MEFHLVAETAQRTTRMTPYMCVAIGMVCGQQQLAILAAPQTRIDTHLTRVCFHTL
jgi:hypothetical protein